MSRGKQNKRNKKIASEQAAKNKTIIMTTVFAVIILAIIVTVVVIAMNSDGINFEAMRNECKTEYKFENIKIMTATEMSSTAKESVESAYDRLCEFPELFSLETEYTAYWAEDDSGTITYNTSDDLYALCCSEDDFAVEIRTILLHAACDEYFAKNDIRVDHMMVDGVCYYLASEQYPKTTLSRLDAYSAYKQYKEGNDRSICFCIAQYSLTVNGHSLKQVFANSEQYVDDFMYEYTRDFEN